MTNLVLGRGILFFDEFAPGTENTQGEFLLAQTPGFTITSASEDLDHYNQDSGVRVLDESILLQLDRTGAFEVQDITPRAVGMFIAGTVGSVAQVATPVVDEPHTVKLGHYYQLGASDADPSGVRNVSTVVVTNDTGVTTYTAGTDYTVDLVTGRLFILDSGTITEGQDILVDYTPAVENRSQVIATADRTVEGALRFVSNNPKGLNHDVVMPKCQISPNGDWALKGDEWQQIGFSYKILRKAGTPGSIIVDGRVIP